MANPILPQQDPVPSLTPVQGDGSVGWSKVLVRGGVGGGGGGGVGSFLLEVIKKKEVSSHIFISINLTRQSLPF